MDPVEHTPTEPADYAALSAIYGTLLAGTALSARNRPAIGVSELPALAAASFALSKLVVQEKVEPPVEGRGGASTDAGDVSWVLPVAEVNAATFVTGVPPHTWQASACAPA